MRVPLDITTLDAEGRRVAGAVVSVHPWSIGDTWLGGTDAAPVLTSPPAPIALYDSPNPAVTTSVTSVATDARGELPAARWVERGRYVIVVRSALSGGGERVQAQHWSTAAGIETATVANGDTIAPSNTDVRVESDAAAGLPLDDDSNPRHEVAVAAPTAATQHIRVRRYGPLGVRLTGVFEAGAVADTAVDLTVDGAGVDLWPLDDLSGWDAVLDIVVEPPAQIISTVATFAAALAAEHGTDTVRTLWHHGAAFGGGANYQATGTTGTPSTGNEALFYDAAGTGYELVGPFDSRQFGVELPLDVDASIAAVDFAARTVSVDVEGAVSIKWQFTTSDGEPYTATMSDSTVITCASGVDVTHVFAAAETGEQRFAFSLGQMVTSAIFKPGAWRVDLANIKRLGRHMTLLRATTAAIQTFGAVSDLEAITVDLASPSSIVGAIEDISPGTVAFEVEDGNQIHGSLVPEGVEIFKLTGANISAVDISRLPGSMREFWISGYSRPFGELTNLPAGLDVLIVYNFDNTGEITVPNVPVFPASMTNVSIRRCTLSEAEVDNVLVGLDTHVQTWNAGAIVNLDQDCEPPSATGEAAAVSLEGKGVTVNRN